MHHASSHTPATAEEVLRAGSMRGVGEVEVACPHCGWDGDGRLRLWDDLFPLGRVHEVRARLGLTYDPDEHVTCCHGCGEDLDTETVELTDPARWRELVRSERERLIRQALLVGHPWRAEMLRRQWGMTA